MNKSLIGQQFYLNTVNVFIVRDSGTLPKETLRRKKQVYNLICYICNSSVTCCNSLLDCYSPFSHNLCRFIIPQSLHHPQKNKPINTVQRTPAKQMHFAVLLPLCNTFTHLALCKTPLKSSTNQNTHKAAPAELNSR